MNPDPLVLHQSKSSARRSVAVIFYGGFSFAICSLAAFSVWAFAGPWFKGPGELALYAAILVVFLGSSGLLMGRLMDGPQKFRRFNKAFIPAFVAYAIVWCAAWFALKFGAGEWLGSFGGCLAFSALICKSFRNFDPFWKAALLLFIFHSAGYFAGGHAMAWIAHHPRTGFWSEISKTHISQMAKLSWGLFYGTGFGAGIGYLFAVCK